MSHQADDARSMADESLPDAPERAPTKRSYRSFKKKFAKLKIQFELRMQESSSLTREELRIQDLSKRIQEQNDQLLEVLMEFNDSIHVPSNLRYDLSTAAEDTPKEGPSTDEVTAASQKLKDAKFEMQNGTLDVERYRDVEGAIKRSKAFGPQQRYGELAKVSHTAPPADESAAANLEHSLGFFTPEHETEYYLAMDARLGDESAILQLSRAPDRPTFTERERESALRNPISVYNWLRRNQPHIFLQDNEASSEKSGSRPSNLRTSKKPPTTQPRKDEETYDDESSIVDNGPVKGKRKREEDAGYKPKNSRSRAKKKDEGATPAKRSKRSSGVGA